MYWAQNNNVSLKLSANLVERLVAVHMVKDVSGIYRIHETILIFKVSYSQKQILN